MHPRHIIAFLILLSLGSGTLQTGWAQTNENLFVYGYFQGIARYYELKSNPHPTVDRSFSFSIQQMNVFMFKQFDANFSAFTSLEITNSFSSEKEWGGLALEQAWVKYDRSSKFRVKAGLLIPTFNNLNTIKDRTPLLPYILRPFPYETVVEDFFKTEELAPQRAGIEVYGTLDLGRSVKLDYATYVGNVDAFVIRDAIDTLPSGSDSTLTKLVGGRIGIRYNALKLGLSSSVDKADLSRIPVFVTDFEGVGVVDRIRVGADLSYMFSRFFFESELIWVHYKLDAAQKAYWKTLVSNTFLLNDELDKISAYALLGVNIKEKFYA